jgi:BirA family transcriptional regulator, biotin operon repressor / biotin---[acetyl-CoA-carboxylase] ligase
LAQQTASNSPGSPFIELQTVDSTNKYAMGLVHAGMAQHGTAVFSQIQTAGKGQRGKSWVSEPGANIALSVIIRPAPLNLHEQFYLSAATALAAHQFFSKYAGEDDTKIKWPNDLYWRDRKAGGVLIESVVSSRESEVGSWEWAVIGIGININQTSFPPDLPNPVSLKQITGKDFDATAMAKELHSFLIDQFDRLINGNKNEFVEKYNQHLYKLNEKVKLKKDNRVFETVINGVSLSGKLMTTHFVDEEFDFGEVEWLMKKVI